MFIWKTHSKNKQSQSVSFVDFILYEDKRLVGRNIPLKRNVIKLFTGMYVRDVKSETTLRNGQPSIEKETVSTALVNGNNILGPVSKLVCFFNHPQL